MRKKSSFPFWELNGLLFIKIENWYIAHSGYWEEEKNVKSLGRRLRQRRRTTDKLWSEKVTWALGSGDLKNIFQECLNHE